MDGRPRHAAMEEARAAAGITYQDLWLRYFSLTGDAAPLEVEAYLHGLMPLPPAEQDILAQALHECLTEQDPAGQGHQDPNR
jgi:hypothetical protein